MTIAFGVGQTLGPIVVGAIADALGGLSYALNVSAAMLALGAILGSVSREVFEVLKRRQLPLSVLANSKWRVANK